MLIGKIKIIKNKIYLRSKIKDTNKAILLSLNLCDGVGTRACRREQRNKQYRKIAPLSLSLLYLCHF